MKEVVSAFCSRCKIMSPPWSFCPMCGEQLPRQKMEDVEDVKDMRKKLNMWKKLKKE